jgi:hypothetical protein
MTISDNGPVPQVQTVPIGPVGGAYATMICTLSRTGQKTGVGEANARLIAAAPDLLQVARDFLLLAALHNWDGAAIEWARTTIAKVEGNA